MNEHTQKTVAFLILGGSVSFFRIVPAVESAPNVPEIAWVPEMTLGLLWAATGVVGAFGELTRSGVEHRDGTKLPRYAWGWVSLLVAIFTVALAFSYLTDDFLRFGVELVAPIGVAMTYFTHQYR